MEGLIEQTGLRIRISKSYQENQLKFATGGSCNLQDLQEAQIDFHLFQTKEAPFRECNPKKIGIGKGKSHGKLAVVNQKFPEYKMCRARCG